MQAALPPRPVYLDPVEYAREVLGIRLWSVQKQIARAVAKGGKVLVKACHSVGKTYLAALLTSWWYDTFPHNSAVLTTAPTARDVRDLLWREVRLQRGAVGLGGFVGDKAPELWEKEDHFAKGMTAKRGESFQGRHLEHMLFIFDEAVGIDALFWDTTKSMFKAGSHHAWLVIGNPTDTASQMYQEDSGGDWQVFEMSAQQHPNVWLGLRGRQPVFPAAVSLEQFESWVKDWCEPIPAGEAQAVDLQWPPGSGNWWRCGPEMEARALGRWPSQATYGVWSDAAWQASQHKLTWDLRDLPEIGCDVARHGDDWTVLIVRWGPCVMWAERHNGWEGPRIVGRLKELAREWAAKATAWRASTAAPITPQQIRCKVDADGMGGLGVVDYADGYCFEEVMALRNAMDQTRYPNKRCELWFNTVQRAKQGRLDLTRIPRTLKARLRSELMAPRWKLDASGRRLVEPKDETKKRLPKLGSPDVADALNLAFYETTDNIPVVIPKETPPLEPTTESGQRRRGYFGMGGGR